jgi:hypothetical protein
MVESLMVSATRKYELIIPNFILNQDPTWFSFSSIYPELHLNPKQFASMQPLQSIELYFWFITNTAVVTDWMLQQRFLIILR